MRYKYDIICYLCNKKIGISFLRFARSVCLECEAEKNAYNRHMYGGGGEGEKMKKKREKEKEKEKERQKIAHMKCAQEQESASEDKKEFNLLSSRQSNISKNDFCECYWCMDKRARVIVTEPDLAFERKILMCEDCLRIRKQIFTFEICKYEVIK